MKLVTEVYCLWVYDVWIRSIGELGMQEPRSIEIIVMSTVKFLVMNQISVLNKLLGVDMS